MVRIIRMRPQMVSVGICLLVRFLKEKTTSVNFFIVWDVSIHWRDIKRDQQGITRKIVNGGEFVKKISDIFDVWRYSADEGFEMKINKLGNAFSRVIVGRDYGPTGIIDLWILGRIKKRPGLGSLCNRYCLVFLWISSSLSIRLAYSVTRFCRAVRSVFCCWEKSRIVELAITFV